MWSTYCAAASSGVEADTEDISPASFRSNAVRNPSRNCLQYFPFSPSSTRMLSVSPNRGVHHPWLLFSTFRIDCPNRSITIMSARSSRWSAGAFANSLEASRTVLRFLTKE